jgi:hypothetical protein
MPTTKNRTYWPTTGGALAFQPGWFSGHQTAMIYVNIGFGNEGPADNPDLQGPPNKSSAPRRTPIRVPSACRRSRWPPTSTRSPAIWRPSSWWSWQCMVRRCIRYVLFPRIV